MTRFSQRLADRGGSSSAAPTAPHDAAPPLAIHTVFSTQNAEQRALAARFEAVALGSQPPPSRSPVHAVELRNVERDDGGTDSFRTERWYRVLVRKVSHWAALADQHPGRLLLCSDNDITLLPGWRDALLRSYNEAGRPDLQFQREGGDDPFFAAFPYNSGFFLMNGSSHAAAFWRHVAARTEREQPFTGDQGIVNNLLVARQADGEPGCTAGAGAAPAVGELRHAHFDPWLVHGGPSVPSAAALRRARVHHATSSGSARGKLRVLETFLDAWLVAAGNRTRAELGLPTRTSWIVEEDEGVG